jgi:phosphoenolpyruvate---glycerone phosphotransferase subunit DhaL
MADALPVAAWIRRAEALIAADADRLTRLDAAIGDGDHGVNLARGFAAAVAALPGDVPPGRVLVEVGRAIIAKTGGAAGPLYGSALRRAGKALGDAGEVGPAELRTALRAALDGIQELGKAVPGDKTMVDALAPGVAAYDMALNGGGDLATCTAAAATAAAEGSAATVPLLARKGRASYLGPRSIGHEDPGAASAALLLRALAEVTAG